jgi:cytoskeleton protein RodZ
MTDVHIKLGRLLKEERERRNISLADLAGDLKIAERHLRAIEEGDLSALPGPLYFGLFSKSYAEALGIDYARSLAAIKEDLGEPVDSPIEQTSDDVATPTTPSPVRPVGSSSSSGLPRGRSMTSWIIISVLLIALVVVAWVLFKTDGRFSLRNLTHRDSAAVADSERSEATDDFSQDYGKTAQKGIKAALNLQLVAHDRTWAVVLADGDTALQTNLKPWREYNIGAQEKLNVSVGTPLAVDMTINGLPVDLSDPDKGTVSNVAVTPENMSMFVRRAPVDSGVADTTDSPDDSLSPDTTGPAVQTRPTSPADTVTHRAAASQTPAAAHDSTRRQNPSPAGKNLPPKTGGTHGT